MPNGTDEDHDEEMREFEEDRREGEAEPSGDDPMWSAEDGETDYDENYPDPDLGSDVLPEDLEDEARGAD